MFSMNVLPTNQPTDRPTNRPTDTAYYRDARTHLKMEIMDTSRTTRQTDEHARFNFDRKTSLLIFSPMNSFFLLGHSVSIQKYWRVFRVEGLEEGRHYCPRRGRVSNVRTEDLRMRQFHETSIPCQSLRLLPDTGEWRERECLNESSSDR